MRAVNLASPAFHNPNDRGQGPTWQSPGRKEVMRVTKQLNLAFPVPEGHVVKFVAFITLKNGVRLYAKQIGKKAFPIVVPAK